VKLSWDPPLNFKRPGEVTAYRISFQPNGRNESDEIVIDKTSTPYLLRRDSGRIASTMHTFAVRAQNTETLGEWKTFTDYVGRCCDLVTVNDISGDIGVIFENEHRTGWDLS